MLVRAARRVAVASAAAPRRCTARRTSTVGDNRVVRLQTEDPRMSKIVIHNGDLPSLKPLCEFVYIHAIDARAMM